MCCVVVVGVYSEEMEALQRKLRDTVAATPSSAPDTDSSAISDGQSGSNFVNSRRNSRDIPVGGVMIDDNSAIKQQLQSLHAKHRSEIEDINNTHARVVRLFLIVFTCRIVLMLSICYDYLIVLCYACLI